jgi:hypothetical protein
MNKEKQLPAFTFDFRKETLTIQYPDGKIEKKEVGFRGHWNSPGFNLEKIGEEEQWLTFKKWGPKSGSKGNHHRIRLFFKRVVKKGEEIQITHYAQEQKYRDKTTFNLSEIDIIYKNEQGKWVFKNKN